MLMTEEGIATVTSAIESYFLDKGKAEPVRRDELLYEEGPAPQDVFFIESGSFVLSRKEGAKDDQILVGHKRKGSLIGEAAALDREIRTVSVRASEDARVRKVTSESFTDALKNNASLSYEVAVELARTLRTATTN